MFRYCLLLLPVFLAACGHERSSGSAAMADSNAVESTAPPTGDFYKRYSGTLAGKQVVLQLHRHGADIHGSYQYSSIGQVIQLRDWADTVAGDEELILSEIVPGAEEDGATWSLTLRGHTAKGEWRSSDGARRLPINLAEEYPAGCTRLSAFYIADSAALFPDKPNSPKASTACSYLLPADENSFLYDVLRKLVAPNSRAGDDIVAALKAGNAAYFETYRKENAALFGGQDNEDAALFALDYSEDEVMSVLYNDDDWLVTETFVSSYTGGAHGNYGSAYANIDLKQQRLWGINDIIGDTAPLWPMLNDAAIAYFRLKPGERLGERLLVSEVPVTENVYLSASGLCFVYHPYEIASYSAGQISLFLPYKKLMPFLTPAFKTRMHLTGRAGVAMLSTEP
jgi:hypothetical protein